MLCHRGESHQRTTDSAHNHTSEANLLGDPDRGENRAHGLRAIPATPCLPRVGFRSPASRGRGRFALHPPRQPAVVMNVAPARNVHCRSVKEVRIYKTETEADCDAGLLLAQGIPCEVRNRRRSNVSALEPSVWVVKDEDLSRALEVLDYRPDPSGRAWVCPKCKSESEAQFDACWSCGTDRS